MANIDIKFLDGNNYIQVNGINSIHKEDNFISITGYDEIAVPVNNELDEIPATFSIWLDVSTAIKFAKTLRTEINKIKEVDNGR